MWCARQDSNLRPSLFVVILLHRQGGTVGDRETKPRFYRKLTLLKGQGGTGRDTGLWYRCGTKGSLTYSIGGGGRVPRRSPPARTSAPSAPSGTLPQCSGTSAARTQTPTTRQSRPDGSHRISRPTTPRTSSRHPPDTRDRCRSHGRRRASLVVVVTRITARNGLGAIAGHLSR